MHSLEGAKLVTIPAAATLQTTTLKVIHMNSNSMNILLPVADSLGARESSDPGYASNESTDTKRPQKSDPKHRKLSLYQPSLRWISAVRSPLLDSGGTEEEVEERVIPQWPISCK